jgi:hypothetical protein
MHSSSTQASVWDTIEPSSDKPGHSDIGSGHYIPSVQQGDGLTYEPAASFHFRVSHAASAQFEQFTNMKMARKIKEVCPTLWQLFGILLNGSPIRDALARAVQQGDYLTELILDHKVPETNLHRQSGTSNASVSAPDDLPEEDWGGQSDMDDSSD